MSPSPKRPLSKDSVEAANQAVAKQMEEKGESPRKVTMASEDAEYRKTWTDAYYLAESKKQPAAGAAPDYGTKIAKTNVGGTTTTCKKKWDQKCVLDVLCKNDKKIVDEQLAKAPPIVVGKNLYREDHYFDGKQWTTRQIPLGGWYDLNTGEITAHGKQSCEDASVTLHHELTHKNDKQNKTMNWPSPREEDAYYKTELWAIQRGLPPQFPGARKKDANGKPVPDKDAIQKHVKKNYPTPSSGQKKQLVAADPQKNLSKWRFSDGTEKWLPSKKGDTIAGPSVIQGAKRLRPWDWKCP